MAVVLAESYNVNSVSNTINQTITTPSFTPVTGELIVLKVVSEDTGSPAGTPSATGGGITWTKRTENKVASTCYAAIWTGIVTAGGSAITVSVTISGGVTGYVSMVLEGWTGAQLGPAPSLCYINGTTGAATGTITVVSAGSMVSWLDGDWNASTGTITYVGSGPPIQTTQDGYHTATGAYTAYYAYQIGIAGSQSFGLTSPTTQTYTLLAIEIQASGQANSKSGTMMTMGVGI
ncbi:MAG: hypothetical protein JWO99_593 [Candidatus Saccharibacteria bacterium]|nr:hypothetical protein [Candidatus Saccharibacteria bacterium]